MRSERWRRYIPLAVWGLVCLTLLLIPLQIISQGYLPGDDGLRYAAKAVSGKAWPEILVMRPGLTLDHNPGWNVILGWIHRSTHAEPDALVTFSVVALMLLFCLAPLPWLRRPEAWLGILLIMSIFAPALLLRISFGRPFVVPMAVLVSLLLMWSRFPATSPPFIRLASSTLLIGLAVWLHGAWYLFGLPFLAFLLAGQWRASVHFGGCWALGTVLGASLTGHPFQFIAQAFQIFQQCFSEPVLQRMLVAEFCSFDGDFRMLLATGVVLLAMRLNGRWDFQMLRNPLLMLALLGWLLGFKAHRCWLDWGLPALLIWLALEAQSWLAERLADDSARRLWLTCFLALGLYGSATSDLGGRWTDNLTVEYLRGDDPALAEWLPGKDGIIYNSDMRIFYQTFFKNPHASWRYVLGFEPTFMSPEDLRIFRKIQWNYGDPKAYEPWVKKMRPADRLILRGPAGNRPAVPGLDWHYGATDTWIGRLPNIPNIKQLKSRV